MDFKDVAAHPYVSWWILTKLSHTVDVHLAIVITEFAMCYSEFLKHSYISIEAI